MKKIILLALSAILLTLTLVLVTGCTQEPTPPTPEESGTEEAITIEFEEKNVKVCVGGSLCLTPVVTNTRSEISWSSSKASVATVDGGVVTAVGVGTTTVTATVDGISAECVVTVTDEVAVIKPYVSNVVVGLGQAYDLSVKTMFGGEEIPDLEYTWVSKGNSVMATYNEKKDVVTLRGIGEGKSELTVSTTVFGVTFYTNVSVEVINTLTSWTVEGYGIAGNGANGYFVNLNIDDTSSPDITLLYNNKPVTNASKVWTAGDDSIATVSEDGKITAIASGETTISCLVDDDYTIYFDVKVERPIVLMDTVYNVQTSDGAIEITDELKGEVQSVTINGVEVFESVQGNCISLDPSKLLFELKQMGEGREMVVMTDKVSYVYSINLYTKIITTAQEFKDMASYMNRSAGDYELAQYTGYVVLGNDIDLSEVGAFNLFTRESFTGTSDASQAQGNGNNSFNGTFDGKGYTIKNYTANGRGLFNTIGSGGVIRNVAFVDVVAPQAIQYIFSERFSGRIENVYVSIKSWESGAVFHNWYAAGQNMVNVVVEYTGAAIEGERLLNGSSGHLKYTNVYVVGNISSIKTHCDSKYVPHDSCVGVYKNIAQFYASSPDLASFDAEVWNTQYGIPTIDSVAESNSSVEFEIKNSDKYVALNSTLTLNSTSNYVIWSLDTPVEGLTIDGDKLILGEGAVPSEVTITATNIFDLANPKTYTFNTINVEEYKSLPLSYIEIYGAADKPRLEIDLSSVGAVDSIISVKINGTDCGFSYESGVFSINKSELAAFISNDISMDILLKRGESYVMVSITGKVVTKAISTAEEFKNMATYMDKSEGLQHYYHYTGYIVLANDIDLTGVEPFSMFIPEAAGSATGEDKAQIGFNGTLDGQGFAVKNYTAGQTGLFNSIGEDAIITNIAFLDIIAPEGTRYIFAQRINPFFYNSTNGWISDVYVSIKTWESGILFGHPYAAGQNLQQVVVNYTGEAIDGERFFFNGANGHTTRQNLYFIGDITTLNTYCDEYGGHAEGSCVGIYKTMAELQADTEKDLSVFTASVWEREDVPLKK